MTFEKLKEHCKKQMGMYGGHVSSNVYLEHSMVLDLINEHENRTKHDAELLDKVAEKLKARVRICDNCEIINCDIYTKAMCEKAEEGLFAIKFYGYIDEVIAEMKAEMQKGGAE